MRAELCSAAPRRPARQTLSDSALWTGTAKVEGEPGRGSRQRLHPQPDYILCDNKEHVVVASTARAVRAQSKSLNHEGQEGPHRACAGPCPRADTNQTERAAGKAPQRVCCMACARSVLFTQTTAEGEGVASVVRWNLPLTALDTLRDGPAHPRRRDGKNTEGPGSAACKVVGLSTQQML